MADRKPIFKRVAQVAMVVKDLDEAVKRHWDLCGIGPWRIYTFDPSTVTDMVLDDRPEQYAMRLALTTIGDVSWELIQPLDDKSIYAQFLKEHGEGLHHVLFDVEDHNETIQYFQSRGIGVKQGGTWGPVTYTYLETDKVLSFIAEIVDRQEAGTLPPPEATYP
jgi:hypothetical protein